MNLAGGLDVIFSIFRRIFDLLVNVTAFDVSLGTMILVTFVVRHVYTAVFNINYSARVRVNPNSPGTKQLTSGSSVNK